MNFGNNLRVAREKQGITQQQVADLMGITKSTYCGYEIGKRQPDVFKIKQLAHIIHVAADTLLETEEIKATSLSDKAMNVAKIYDGLDEHGRRIVNSVLSEEQDRMKILTLKPKKKKIHLYDTPAAAGEILPCPGDDYKEIEVDEDSPADFAVHVSGDSMEPLLKNGSIAYIHRQDTILENECGIFFVDGGMVLKRFKSWNGKRVLEAVNRARANEDIIVDKDFVYKCYGKVLLSL